jgi:MFS-type transporter involved in bile tolerance (Atg22 family)
MLLSIGGILGSVCSAYFTEYLTPQHTFLVCSILSLVIVVAGYFINPAIERTETDHASQSLRQNLRRNISEIKEAMK